ncbi:hypothetical protein D3C77_366050 [compost metagenome]
MEAIRGIKATIKPSLGKCTGLWPGLMTGSFGIGTPGALAAWKHFAHSIPAMTCRRASGMFPIPPMWTMPGNIIRTRPYCRSWRLI